MEIMDEVYQGKILYKKKIRTNIYAFDKGVLISKYLFSLGMNEHEVESEITKKFKKMFSDIFGESEAQRRIKYIIDRTIKEGIPANKMIALNQAEIDAIFEIQDDNEKIILTFMIFLYKYCEGEFQLTVPEMIKITKLGMLTKEATELLHNVMSYGYFNMYVKKVKEYESTRYLTYYKPSDKLLDLVSKGGSVFRLDDFRNIHLRIRMLLNIEYGNGEYYFCERCGILDTRKSVLKEYCTICKNEKKEISTQKWIDRTGWVHPNRKESEATFYYKYKPKK